MTVRVAESRTVPLAIEAAYDGTIDVPLPDIFGHRYLAMPPVVRIEDQDGPWGRELGQTRTIRTSDGGALHETLRVLERPQRFGYRIDQIRGPMRPLVRHLDGAWTFEPDGTGTRITWSWEMTPTSPLTAPLVRVVGSMWRTYAQRSLANLESVLTA
jgi:hypothetical protein